MVGISITVPMFNESANIEQLINYANKQTDDRFEIIFVDDGSTDDTMKKVLAADKRFTYKVVILPTNQTLPNALNAGHAMAQYPYLAWWSCDSHFYAYYVAEMLKEAEAFPDADILQAPEGLAERGSVVRVQTFQFPVPKFLNVGQGAAFAYKWDLWHKIRYRTECFLAEDLDFFCRAVLTPGVQYHWFRRDFLLAAGETKSPGSLGNTRQKQIKAAVDRLRKEHGLQMKNAGWIKEL